MSRCERERTKTIDKKCQEDQKLRTIKKKQENHKKWHDTWDRLTRLTMQSWQLLMMFTIQDNIDTICNIDMANNVDKMLILHFADLGQLFLHLMIDIGFTFKPFIFLSRKMELCGGLDPVAKMPRRRKMKPLCAQFNTPLHTVMQSCTQIYLL